VILILEKLKQCLENSRNLCGKLPILKKKKPHLLGLPGLTRPLIIGKRNIIQSENEAAEIHILPRTCAAYKTITFFSATENF
jgi:hypothetical protein